MSVGEPVFPAYPVIEPAVPETCPAGLAPYAIRPGDTLFELAQRGRTTVEIIMSQNPGLDPCNLPIGQVICLPFEAVIFPGYGVKR